LITAIGSDNLLMAYCHVAHDVLIGDHVIMANAVTLAGHVTIGDWADISAFTGVHQFCRIGRHAFVGPYSVVVQDVLPFSTTVGKREISVFGANRIGLERRGFEIPSSKPCRPHSACSRAPNSIPRRPSSGSAPKSRPAPKWTNCSPLSAPANAAW